MSPLAHRLRLIVSRPTTPLAPADVTVTNSDTQFGTLTGGFTYQTAPVLATVSPPAGALGGGTTLSLTGTNFLAGITVNVGGGNCSSVNLISSTQLNCVAPAHAAGTVNVTVTNADTQFSTLSNSYIYQLAPTLTGVFPPSGPVTAGNPLTLTGTSFRAGATVTVGGNACTSVSISSSTQITCYAPAGVPGMADIVVTNTDTQFATLVSGYTFEVAPAITSVSPTGGNTAGGTAIIINGSGFTAGAAINMGGAACNATLITTNQIFCTTTAHAAGTVSITVTNTDTQVGSLASAYTFEPPPTLAAVFPVSGSINGGTSLALSGTGFLTGITVSVGGSPCSSVTLISSTQLTCTTPPHASGLVSLVVTNTDNQAATLSNSYTFNAAPTMNSVSPVAGPITGGNTLTLTGTGYLAGATVSVGGSVCSSVSVVSTTQITCMAPIHAAGTVDVTVTNVDSQTGTLTNAYTYDPAPTLSSIVPPAGALGGGTTVTLTGSGFLAGASVTIGGAACGSINIISATSITCVTPAHAAATLNVTVTNTDTQSATLSASYTYEAAPTLSSVSPVAGPLAGGTLITVTGTHFLSGIAITVGGAACSGVTLSSATSVSCSTPAHAAGLVDIVATNTDLQSATLSSSYTYQPAPTIGSVAPPAGPLAGGTPLTITGTGFLVGATVTVGGSPCSGMVVVSATQVTCNTPGHSAGPADVVLTNTDGQSGTLAASFTYQAAPTIASLTPNSGALAGGTAIIVAGTGFITGASVTIGGNACNAIVVNSPIQITCSTPAHVAGTVSALVANTDGQSFTLPNAYTYEPAPTVTAISPVAGSVGGGTPITITGTGFLTGASVTLGGTACTSVTVSSGTSLTCTSGAHVAGVGDITVANADTQFGTLVGGYTYQPAPTVTSISPASGPTFGGTNVIITGTNFLAGATANLGGLACSVTLVTSTQVYCTTGAHSAGIVSVQVVNTDNQTGSLVNGYTYQVAPQITSINPTAGPLLGGNTLSLTGADFIAGASVRVGLNTCSSPNVLNPNLVSCVVPSGLAGTYDVTLTNPDGQFFDLAASYTYEPAPSVGTVAPTAGAVSGGTALTITGTGFLTGAAVTVGGSTCTTVVVVSATQITCNTPAHLAGAVDIVVTNADQQVGTLANGYTYEAAPSPGSRWRRLPGSLGWRDRHHANGNWFCHGGHRCHRRECLYRSRRGLGDPSDLYDAASCRRYGGYYTHQSRHADDDAHGFLYLSGGTDADCRFTGRGTRRWQ